MNNGRTDTVLIITQHSQLLHGNILGTSGWFPPEEREVVDWMTLIRFMGWNVEIVSPSKFEKGIIEDQNVKWVILTGIAEGYDTRFMRDLLFILQSKPILFISQAAVSKSSFANLIGVFTTDTNIDGQELQWVGKGVQKSWKCHTVIQLGAIQFATGHTVICKLDGYPVITSQKIGNAKIISIGFHSSAARDLDGVFTALLKHLLIYESLTPVAWYKWDNTVILRMDDPGSLEVVYNEAYQNTKLAEEDWCIIGEELKKRKARMSLGYVSGWVDDGNTERGELRVAGETPARIRGAVYPSPKVRYEKKNNINSNIVYNYESEFKGVQNLRKEGLVEVELHGYTHLHPDRQKWAEAKDRYSNTFWYREFGETAVAFFKSLPVLEQPFYLGINTLKEYFNIAPSTLICPGDEFTNHVLEQVLESELLMVSSYYLAIKIGKQLCWAQHICAPYLNEADAKWFKSELPVVGYFHDFDISINGVSWFSDCLNKWEEAGAVYLKDFREVAGPLSNFLSLYSINGDFELSVVPNNNFDFITPTRIGLFFPEGAPNKVRVKICDNEKMITIDKHANLEISVTIPSLTI